MSENKRIRIKVSEVFNNLEKCSNPLIEFEQGSGYLVPCEGEDYIEIIPLGDVEGLAVWIKCEDCDICGWKKVLITPCDDDTDCEDCAVCSPSGYCVYICADDEVCDDGKCAECDDTHPCANGKVCTDGKCECPPEKPFWNGKECRACLTNEECGNCFICTSDGCKPKDCGNGACDPETGDCVECMNSGDCKDKDPNACCNSTTHKCECCEGFTKNFETGLCEPEPECVLDDDCNDPCKYCDDGKCTTVKCPEGYICYEGDCVKICDCDAGGCPDGQTCIPYGDVCICVECLGDCQTTDDCDDGCMCGNLKKCIPNPCQGSCEDGTDCGDGCGCNKDTKMCEPCSDKDCGTTDTCNDLDGCNCDGSNCEDSDNECSGTCTDFRDCAGVNCTCIKGKCVSCDNFPCKDGLCDSIPGCKCENNVDCVGSSKGCEDTFTFEKDGCGAKIDLTLKDKCPCKDLILNSKLIAKQPLPPPDPSTSIIINASYSLELRKNVVGYPLLGEISNEGIANNELPISGIVEFKVRYYLENHNTRFDAGFIDEAPVKFDLANKDKIDYDFTIWDVGSDYDGENDVTKSVITVTVVDDIKLENGCVYKKGTVLATSTCSDALCEIRGTKSYSSTLVSKSFVDPLLKVFRTKDDTFTVPYRKLYKTAVSLGKYTDKLYGAATFTLGKQILVPDEGLLLGNQTYMATNDCSCEKYASFGKVINCEPVSLSYNLSECNSDIVLNGFTPQCSTNKDLSWYGLSNDDINFSQASWKLYINGVEVAKFQFFGDPNTGEVKDVNTLQPINGWTFTTEDGMDGVPIETIELKMFYGDTMVCDDIVEKIDNNIPIPENAITCPAVTSTVYYNEIQKTGTSGYTVTSVSAKDANDNSVYVEDKGSFFKVHAPFGITTTVRVTYNTGCIKTYDIKENCCGSFNVTASASNSDPGCGGDLLLTGTANGGAKSITWKWTTPDGQTLTGQNQTLSSYVNGTYTLEGTDDNGCVSTDTVDVNILGMEFNHPDSLSVCEGGDANIELSGTNGAVVEYRIGTGSLEPVTLPATITVQNVTASTIVTYKTISYGGCTNNINEITSLVVVDNATAEISASVDTQQCVGSSAPTVPVDGTPNVIVDYTVNNVADSIQLDAAGTGEIQLPNTAGSYAVHLTKATLGACVNNLDDLETILVQNSPTINIYSNSYNCSSAGGGAFQYEVQFEVFDNTGNPTSNAGTVSNVSGNIWKVTGIPSGTAATISASNGTCVTQQLTQAYNCDCNAITVPPPAPTQSIYTFCTGSVVPQMEVTLDPSCINCKADWYDAEVGGTKVAGNTKYYTPPAPGAGYIKVYYVEAVDLDSGCKSNRVAVTIEEAELPNSNFDEDANNVYCIENIVNFSIPYEAGVSYLWEVTGGTIQGSSSATSISVQALNEGGLMNVKLTATNLDGCETSTNHDYRVDTISFTLDAYDCANDSVVLHLGAVASEYYKVTFESGSYTKIFDNSGAGYHGGQDITLTGLDENGTYSVTVENISGKGCTKTINNYEVWCVCKALDVVSGGDEGDDRIYAAMSSNKTLNWEFEPRTLPDRFIIKVGGVVVIDTTPVTSLSTCSATANWAAACLVNSGNDKGIRMGDLVLAGAANGSIDLTTKENIDGSNGVGTANYDFVPHSVKCNNTEYAGWNTIPYKALEVGSAGHNEIEAYLTGTITVLAGNDIEIIVEPNSCGSTGTQWRYKIECV